MTTEPDTSSVTLPAVPVTDVMIMTTEKKLRKAHWPRKRSTVVINVTTNCLIRDGKLGGEAPDLGLQPAAFLRLTDGELLELSSPWQRVERLLKKNGKEGVFTISEWMKEVQARGVMVSDKLDDWQALAWELAVARAPSLAEVVA
jgi:hypothetical protein